MQTIRLLVVLVLVSACSAINAELPKRIGPSSFGLALYDIQGLWGGQEVFVLTNGVVYARTAQPPKKKENGLQEKRYKIQLSTTELQSLKALLDQHQFLTLTNANRKAVPDESGAIISLRFATNQGHDVFQWEKDAQAGFKAIRLHLISIERRAEKTKPIFQGQLVYEWTPIGFAR